MEGGGAGGREVGAEVEVKGAGVGGGGGDGGEDGREGDGRAYEGEDGKDAVVDVAEAGRAGLVRVVPAAVPADADVARVLRESAGGGERRARDGLDVLGEAAERRAVLYERKTRQVNINHSRIENGAEKRGLCVRLRGRTLRAWIQYGDPGRRRRGRGRGGKKCSPCRGMRRAPWASRGAGAGRGSACAGAGRRWRWRRRRRQHQCRAWGGEGRERR